MSEYSTNNSSYIEWSTIIAGAVLASALSLVMLQFGSAVGVANMDNFRDMTNSVDTTVEVTRFQIMMTTLYILIVQVLSSMLGAYVAGRMRAPASAMAGHEREIRDGVHGVLTWATASIAVMVCAALAAAFAHLTVAKTAETEHVKAVMDYHRNIPFIIAFSIAATSLVSAVASWVAGVYGGDHRDNSVDHSRYITFLVKR